MTTMNGDVQQLSTFMQSLKNNVDLLRNEVAALKGDGTGGGSNNEQIREIADYINRLVPELRRLDSRLDAGDLRLSDIDRTFGNRLEGLRTEVNELLETVNYGLSEEELFPWSYGVAYSRRNVASAESTRGGTWVAEMAGGAVIGSLVGDTFDWSIVTAMVFHIRDARGTDVSELFRNEIFAESGVPIGILFKEPGEVLTRVGFTTVGDPERVGNYGYRFRVQRALTYDQGQVADVAPPHDSDYVIRLMLPALQRDTFGIAGRPRGAQHFWAEIDASLVAGLQTLGDDENWEGLAASEANAATDGPNRLGDWVTLYRGNFRQTRAWDPVDAAWVPFTPIFGDNLIGINGILADHVAADQILARHLVSNSIITRHLTALAITGDKIAAGTIDASTKLTALQAAISVLTVDWAQMRNVSVNNAQIANLAVGSLKIAGRAVTGAKLALGSVSGSHIVANAIGSLHIVANAIGSLQIAANAVGSAQIAIGAILGVNIAVGAVGSLQIAALGVGSTNLASGAVTGSKVASSAIGALQIAAGAVGSSELAADSVTAAKIAAGAIGSLEISAGAITSLKIAAGAIGSLQIGTNAVSRAKLAAAVRTELDRIPSQFIQNVVISADKTPPRVPTGFTLAGNISQLEVSRLSTASGVVAHFVEIDKILSYRKNSDGQVINMGITV